MTEFLKKGQGYSYEKKKSQTIKNLRWIRDFFPFLFLLYLGLGITYGGAQGYSQLNTQGTSEVWDQIQASCINAPILDKLSLES